MNSFDYGKKGDFILHLPVPLWNSFPWEVNIFPEAELQNIRVRSCLLLLRANPYFRALL
jgi:hypothetical protein